MKLKIKQIIPVSNYWNIYMNEESQQEVALPVSGLALVEKDGEEAWTYIDMGDIQAQSCPDVFESLTYLFTRHSETMPNEFK